MHSFEKNEKVNLVRKEKHCDRELKQLNEMEADLLADGDRAGSSAVPCRGGGEQKVNLFQVSLLCSVIITLKEKGKET